jgi:hypothetical protein
MCARIRRGGEGPPPSTVKDYHNTVHRYLIAEFGNDTLLHTIDTERIDDAFGAPKSQRLRRRPDECAGAPLLLCRDGRPATPSLGQEVGGMVPVRRASSSATA